MLLSLSCLVWPCPCPPVALPSVALPRSVPTVTRATLITRATLCSGARYDLLERCTEGPKELLDSTEVSQPAIFVASMAAVEKLRQDEGDAAVDAATVAMGLSLGEYVPALSAPPPSPPCCLLPLLRPASCRSACSSSCCCCCCLRPVISLPHIRTNSVSTWTSFSQPLSSTSPPSLSGSTTGS